ncbi:histone deacetylase [Desulfopila sp. IMCC35008]|uniref:histone deacetylase family protein n=1 Tax=Desulfopila sp. IMCC35008 TaxID=2653858 RepID=UPI0013D083EA|nr:histone deacetylase [Desulfopila sp. IMCC35008]
MNNRCGLLFDERYFHHRIDGVSLENPDRIRNLYSEIRNRYEGRYVRLPAREATTAQIEGVHSPFYLDQIRNHAIKPDPYSYDPDTYLMEESFATARLAAGGCLALCDAVMAGDLDVGYGLVRPPGHHAEPGRGMGFCVLNNVGIAAQYLRDFYQLSRILVLDFDVHHGNGTQELFYETGEVLFVSVHERDIFPNTGASSEVGRDAGEGYTINVPTPSHFGDDEYTFLVGKIMQGVVEQYMPQVILVSAGYDGHADDPISATMLSTRWFGTVTTMLKQYAAESCNNRLIFILEGGYNQESLQASVLASLDSLMAPAAGRVGVMHSERASRILRDHPLKKRWNIL